MPLSDRVLAAAVGPPGAAPDLRRRALDVLLADDLAHVVDLVALVDGEEIEVGNAAGRTRFAAEPPYEVTAVDGRDPIANTDPLAFTPLAAEPRCPDNAANHYPWARERLADLFRDPNAPDLVVVHTPAHHWPERGGHLGEHGSLDAVQSRAPLVLAGAGVTARGVLDRTARLVDVAPLLRRLAGVADAPPERLAGLAEPGARHVVGLLWDGTNANDLLHLAATGALPNVARLLERGCALRGGAVAEFPSVTLTNHATALTGVGPGGHGILHNAFWDRERGRRVVPNDAGTWHVACDSLRPGVETVFESVGGATAAVNEPVDRGARYSTFGLVRGSGEAGGARGMMRLLPDAASDPYASRTWVVDNPDYAWGTSVDALGLAQVEQLWTAAEPPRLTWWNTTLTDAAHHAGGPHSPIARAALRDADARLGAFLDLVDARGLADDTVVVLTSDHGSEAADPGCRGDWDAALTAAGLPFRDEGYGFVYLGVR